jgi:hypothetical protein
MKLIVSVLISFLFVFSVRGKETKYTGSTPANQVVRTFLGISSADSVDFIRWSVAFENNKYMLRCNYGIGKPNTTGFINGGKWVELQGALKKEGNHYHLQNANKSLVLIEVNTDLLHILDGDDKLSVGNGGWSYTLNRVAPVVTDEITVAFKNPILKDSMAYQGRTPCGVPGMKSAEKPCYKLKWYLVFYADAKSSEPLIYKLRSVVKEQVMDKVGAWKITVGKHGRIIYELKDQNGNAFVNLIKLDDNILAFADADEKLLVGNEDFSYTLSRKW